MATNDVKIRLVGENQASPAINKVKQDLGGLDKAAGTATGGLSGLAKVAGAAGLLALGAQAASATVELAKLGSASIAMKASFEQMAGGAENAASILDALTTASRGTISQYDLMLTANRSMLLGVADSAEEFSQLMQIATVRGRAMGLSTTQAFNDIVTGLGRESKLILDNLGIIIDLEKAHEDYATSIGKTAAQLTDAERKQALINQVIASSADLLKDANSNAKALAGEGYAQLATAWTDFRTALGESLAPILEARAKELAGFLVGVTDQLDEWSTEDRTVFAPQLANAQVEQTKQALASLRDELFQKTTDPIGAMQLLADLRDLEDGSNEAWQAWQEDINSLAAEIIKLQGELDVLLGKQQEVAKAATVESRAAIAPDLQPTLSNAGDAALFNTERQIQAALDMVKAANASLGEANRQGNAEAADVARGYLDNLIPAIRTMIYEYNALAEAQGRQSIVGVSYGNAEIIYQTADALEAEKKAAEDLATALEIVGESGGKLQGLYDTLLDSGNIDSAAASFETIKGVITDITEGWVAQGKSVEEIQGVLLPKLIAEIDNLIGKQLESGDAGITAGELIGTGFLSALPGIETIIAAVATLTGNVLAAGESIRAVQRQAGASLSQFAPGRGTIGAGGALAGGPGATLGRSQVDRSFGGLGGALNRRQSGIGVEPFGIVGGVGASFGGAGGGGGSIDNEAQKLANRLTSILNGALKSGIDLDSILGRQDAIEEPARRLADIAVRGFESPWVDYIRNTFPEIWKEIESAGDPKAAAASILRDFEDGLRPELLDKNRAKELVKRALLGEQNTAALAAEIAGELATELGVSLQQAQAAAAGVLGTGTGDSTETGLDGGTAASSFTDAFIGTMAGMLERFKGAGQSAGSQWGIGFMGAVEGGVPTQLIGLLVTLVTPGVMANMAAGSGRTGAS